MADNPWSYGPYAPEAQKDSFPPGGEAKTALAAYTLLQVDIGWLSPKAGSWFEQTVGTTPGGFRKVDAAPVARTISTPIGLIGVVLFAEGPVPGKAPAPLQEQQALDVGRTLKNKCALLVGISPWGYAAERDFLPKASGVFNIILGGGEGVSFAHTLSAGRTGVLWLRPDSQGRAVNVLEILKLPGKDISWQENVNFRTKLDWLDNETPSDPAMRAVIKE